MLKKAVFFLLMILLLQSINAQQHYQFFDKYTTQDGLPGDYVSALL